jgi:hypothetical protein
MERKGTMREIVRSLASPLVVACAVYCATGSVSADEHAFVGSTKCKVCHIKEWKSWSETKMAKAFELLKPGQQADKKLAAKLDPNKDYTKDTTCLPCHVTGYGKKGGFTSIEATPDLAGVGCEVCHGAAEAYLKKEHMSLQNKEYKKAALVAVGLTDKVMVEQCKDCHNRKSPFVGPDYVFDFEARKNQGTHEKIPLKYQH